LVSGLRERYTNVFALGPLGSLTPDQAFVLPVIVLCPPRPLGVLVRGVNSYVRPDDRYTAFAVIASRQLGVMVTDAVSYQGELKRQHAPQELERARTELFQHISHEM